MGCKCCYCTIENYLMIKSKGDTTRYWTNEALIGTMMDATGTTLN